jgi:putative protease
MSLRAKSKFPLEEMEDGISFAHNIGKKVYLTFNLPFLSSKKLKRYRYLWK